MHLCACNFYNDDEESVHDSPIKHTCFLETNPSINGIFSANSGFNFNNTKMHRDIMADTIIIILDIDMFSNENDCKSPKIEAELTLLSIL